MLIYNPRQTVIITCKGVYEHFGRQEEREEQLVLNWHSPASMHPPTYAIFIRNDLTAKQIIERSKVFAVNFVPFSLALTVKISMAGKPLHLATIDCQKIDCPRLKDVIGVLECEVSNVIPIGDCTLFIGKVVTNVFDHEDKRLFHEWDDRFTTTQ
ncbi:flavin reductase [Candidatus Woesearchaeota archaeon]|nr:flavin reductase [Candidatus Woesearchaeota archaeon]